MFTIIFVINNQIDFVWFFGQEILKHNLNVLKERQAKIISIKNDCGETINV